MTSAYRAPLEEYRFLFEEVLGFSGLASVPGFAEATPFVLALVTLAEGPRMMTNIVDCDPESVRIGMAVTVTFDDVTEEVTLPKFRPA